MASRNPPATSLGKCQPSERTENETASAKIAPASAASGRSRAGATSTPQSASVMAAVACPLGNAAGLTVATDSTASQRG